MSADRPKVGDWWSGDFTGTGKPATYEIVRIFKHGDVRGYVLRHAGMRAATPFLVPEPESWEEEARSMRWLPRTRRARWHWWGVGLIGYQAWACWRHGMYRQTVWSFLLTRYSRTRAMLVRWGVLKE